MQRSLQLPTLACLLITLAWGSALPAQVRDRDAPDRDQPNLQRERDEPNLQRDRDERPRSEGSRDERSYGAPPRPEADRPESESRRSEPGPRTQLLPPRDDPRRGGDWKLGVYADNTPVGVRITGVIRGSAAWDAGLEQDDVIVTVDGYQVGYVGRETFPLGRELQLRADREGRVTLLVQNHRNDRLVNVTAYLQRAGSD